MTWKRDVMQPTADLTPEEREAIFLEELARRGADPTLAMSGRVSAPLPNPSYRAVSVQKPDTDWGTWGLGAFAVALILGSGAWLVTAIGQARKAEPPAIPPYLGPAQTPKVAVKPLYGTSPGARPMSRMVQAPSVELRPVETARTVPQNVPTQGAVVPNQVPVSPNNQTPNNQLLPTAESSARSPLPMFTEKPLDEDVPKVSITNLTKFAVTLVLKRDGADAVRFTAEPLHTAWISAPAGEYSAELQSAEPGVELGKGMAILKPRRAYEAVVVVHTVKGKQPAPGFGIGQ